MKRNVLISVAVVFLLIAAGVARSIMNFAAQEEEDKRLAEAIPQFLSANLDATAETELYRNGKVVIVDSDEKTIDYFTHRKLPEYLRAQTADEVGTVILLEWVTETVGTYRNQKTGEVSGDANRISANMRIIDWKERKLLGTKFIQGEEPMQAVSSEGDHAHYRPMFDVVSFVENLPTR